MPCATATSAARTYAEAFGFVDGISQPAMRGTRRAQRTSRTNDIVEPGELMLGYPDNLGRFPPTPSIARARTRARLLPTSVMIPIGSGRNSRRARATGRRDLGRNGTFLVVRQLEQDVDAFENGSRRDRGPRGSTADEAEGALCREMIAAKIVGRWKNGTSLVRYPDAPGPDPKEARMAGERLHVRRRGSDGLRCPIGAHIRRANPRDSSPGSKEQLAAVNRHRILRVGRSYDAGRRHPGLLFMCVNVDIERQFEFIQQRWLLNPSFQGLQHETDPLRRSRGADRR